MKKIYNLVSIILISCIFIPVTSGEDTEQDYNTTKGYIRSFHEVNTSLPTNNPQQRGEMGEIISRLFDSNGKIGNWYLKVLGNRSNGAILRWSGGNGGQLIQGSIFDNGTNVGIGNTNPNYKLDVSGDVNFSGDLRKNGSILDISREIAVNKRGDSLISIHAGVGGNGLNDGTAGQPNVYLGPNVGFSNTSGYWNVFLGDDTGRSNTTGHRNVFLGENVGRSHQSGSRNVFIGSRTGYSNINGSGNIFMGQNAGYWNTSGGSNVFLGSYAGNDNQSGISNVFIGLAAGQNSTGNTNVAIGRWAGINLESGENNIAIGTNTDFRSANASNQLNIGNWIYGTNGNIGIGTDSPTHKLDVRGAIRQDHTSTTYDVWIQGGAATSGDDRNLAILGLDEDSGDRLVLNHGGEYAGGTLIHGGNFGIGTSNIQSKLTVEGGGDIASAGDETASILIRQDAIRLAIDANEMQSSNNGAASNYAINPHGGNLGVGGFPHSSLKLDVNGKIGATQYCDGSGNNCTNANDLRTKCTALGYGDLQLTTSEETSAGLNTSYRYQIMPDSMSRRCRQKGYDFGFALDLFRNQSGTHGWCGYSNARTVYYAGQSHRWRSTSEIGGGSCQHGSVELGYCCHID